MNGRSRAGWADVLALLALALLTLAYFLPLLGGERVWYRIDFSRDIYPAFHWMHERLSAGLPVSWEQGSSMGDPLFDTGRSPELYLPLRWILTRWDAVQAVPYAWCLHVLWSAIGAYLLARSRACGALAAFTAALATAFAGGMVHSAGSQMLLFPQSWFPWMLLGLCLVQDGSRRAALGAGLLGLATAAAFLSGHIAMGAYQLLALAVLQGAWALRDPWRRLRASALPLAWAALCAGIMVWGQAQALQRAAAQTARGRSFSAAEAGNDPLTPAAFLQAATPHAFGRLADGSYLGASWRLGSFEPQGLILYGGLLSLVLLAYALLRARQGLGPWALAWACILVYAMGPWTPLFRAYLQLPLLGHFRSPVRAAGIGASLLCVPLALAVEHARERRSKLPAWLALGLALALLAGAGVLHALWPWLQAKGEAHIQAHVLGDPLHVQGAAYYGAKLQRWAAGAQRHLAAQGLWALALAAALWGWQGRGRALAWMAVLPALLLFGDLWSNGAGFHPSLPARVLLREPSSVALLKAQAPADGSPYRSLSWDIADHLRHCLAQGQPAGALEDELCARELLSPAAHRLYGLELCNGYPSPDPVRLLPFFGWFRDWDVAQDLDALTRRLLASRRLYDLCGARFILSGRPLRAQGLRELRREPVYAYLNERALPLAWVAERYSGGWSAERAVQALLGPDASAPAPREALVEDAGSGRGRGGGSVRWLERGDARWALDVESRGAGVLVLSRLYYEGAWEARVDGQAVPLLPANGALCAVRLKPGRQTVELRYLDHLERRSRALLALGALLCAAAWAWGLRRRP